MSSGRVAWKGRMARMASQGRTVIAVSVLALLAAACSEEPNRPVVAEELTRMDADQMAIGMTQQLTRDGIRNGEVTADTAFFYTDSTAVHLRSVRMRLYEENGRERAQMEADRARLLQRSQDMTAWGNVVLTIPEGRRIETTELNYSSTENRIWSDSASVMIQDGQVTCGTAFYSDLEFTDATIENARTRGCRQ